MTIDEPGKKLVEIDTITCCHCQAVVRLNKADGTKLSPPPYCLRCTAFQCPTCGAKGTCTPFEKAIEAMEARDRLCRSMGVR